MTSPKCRFCDTPLTHTFADLGSTPLANSFLEPDGHIQLHEVHYPLHARVCHVCLLVQVDQVVSPADLFSDYAYFSSYSDTWVEHSRRFAIAAVEQLKLNADTLVIEVASNDGYLLRHFADLDVPVLGVEPAANIAAAARARDVPTEVCFFGYATAQRLVAAGQRADLLVANNVLAHVPDLNDFVSGIEKVLKPDGIVSIEVPHLLNLIQEVQFDTIYHEHFSYFSLITLMRVMERHGLTISDVEPLPTHGGSLRLWIGHTHEGRTPTERVAGILEAERRASLDLIATYEAFGKEVELCRRSLHSFFRDVQHQGHIVVAYGAAAKGNTLLNYCGVTRDQVAYVVDRSPHKQGKLLPGSHLTIEPPMKILETRPAYVLILPWNLQDEIMEQMAFIRDWGGRFVTPIPRVRVHP